MVGQHAQATESQSGPMSVSQTAIAEHLQRSRLIISVRWLLILLVSLYALLAFLICLYRTPPLSLSVAQIGVVVGCFCTVVFYNGALLKLIKSSVPAVALERAQVVCDLILTSVLVYLSGGDSSWLWPFYLIVVLEAAFLFRLWRCTIIAGSAASLFYAMVLMTDYYRFFPAAELVPETANTVQGNFLSLAMLWLWFSFLSVAVAVIGRYFNQSLVREAQELARRETRLLRFMENTQDLIIGFDDSNRIHYVNRAARQRLELVEGDASLSVAVLIDDLDSERWRNKTCLLGVGVPFEAAIFKLRTASGSVVPVDCRISSDGEGSCPLHWLVCRDLSAQLASEERLHHLAIHDPLTNLVNRHGFVNQAQQALLLAKRYHQQLALAIFSVDHLKVINETLKTESGDTLLCYFSERLVHSVRETDIVGRLAGNQFAVLFVNVDGCGAVERVISKVKKRLAAPLMIDGHELFITSSIGISLYPQDGSGIDDLVRNSGNAMTSVKGHGGNNFAFYSQGMDIDVANRLQMINGLHQALARNELQLHYQPKVNIASGRFSSVEVLLRWQHPTLGQVAPGNFIPMAEESGVIGDLTRWVLSQACQQSLNWQRQGLPAIRVAVNVSGHQLQTKELIGQVTTILEETGLDPQLLEIEVTESILMQNPEAASAILKQLRTLGVHLSIDDFGTGYSSLAYLKRFPVHSLKIDRSFILDIEQSDKYAAITTSIIEMGKSMNLNVIAEGVETLGQLAFLKEHHCDEVQGFLYSMPVPANRIAVMLNNLQDQTNPLTRPDDHCAIPMMVGGIEQVA